MYEMSKYEQESLVYIMSSLTVHRSYRLMFFVVKNHLRDGCSLSQLQSSRLRFLEGLLQTKYTEGVARRMPRVAARRLRPSQKCEESRAIYCKINDLSPCIYLTRDPFPGSAWVRDLVHVGRNASFPVDDFA